MSDKFSTLLSKYIGTGFAKQLALADLLEGRDWGVRISEGIATFGDDLTFPIQLIGTESEGDDTWLWAWANEQSNIPPELLVACNELKKVGEANEIPELTEANFSLEHAHGHMISLVASGLHPTCCYYRGPYQGGALFFLIENVPSDILEPVTPERALTTINLAISEFEVDHNLMVTEFLQQQGYEIEKKPDVVVATRDNSQLEFSFDELGRIVNMNGSLKPSH